MAPVKRAASAHGGLKSRCASVSKAVANAVECPHNVKEMLGRTMSATIGTPKADRHPFNERFVAMIDDVLHKEENRLKNDLASKEAAFNELAPTKTNREAALEHAKGAATEAKDALEKAKQAVHDVADQVHAAATELANTKSAQKTGDASDELAAQNKTKLEETVKDHLTPIVEGSADVNVNASVKVILSFGSKFKFDSSLMSTAAQVLHKPVAERGGFDMTCLDQLKEAFTTDIAKYEAELAAGAPAKAERAATVEHAGAALHAAEASQTTLKEQAAAAKEAKAAADAAVKEAAKSLADFMPDLKNTGDALDHSKKILQTFTDGPKAAFGELKEFKEGDFIPKKTYYVKIDGMSCDREVVDACKTAVAGVGDGRVSVEDAKGVFAAIADGGKETRAERWTLRYCLQEFHWTEAAHDWIIQELAKVPQEHDVQHGEGPKKKARTDGAGYYEVLDGFKCDRGIVDACREAVVGQGDGRVSVEDAQKVWEKAADGNKVTNAEKWTLRYCLSNFHWTRAAHDWMVDQMRKGVAA